jgi:hypothetical protein
MNLFRAWSYKPLRKNFYRLHQHIESPLISVPHALTAISLRELSEEQAQDPWFLTLIEQIEKGD